MSYLANSILTGIAIALAAFLVPGIEPFGAEPWLCFLFVGFFLGIVNSLVKPVLTLLSLPVTILSLGVFQLVINTAMLELASWLSLNLLGAGIGIASYGSAFVGSIIVSIACALLGVAKD